MGDTDSPHRLPMSDADVLFYPRLFSMEDSVRFFRALTDAVPWRQERITLFGRRVGQPRLTAWYGDPGSRYSYSGLTLEPLPWLSVLEEIKARVELPAAISFNSVLLNLYRHGRDSMGWHSDAEPELGNNPVIGSVSFGATRRFQFRRKQDTAQKVQIDLEAGSLLLMRGATQHFWQHQVPKTAATVGPRINLTFRIVLSTARATTPSVRTSRGANEYR